MLETIREFAADLLAASGEGDRLGHRHTLYYLSLAERAAAGLYGPDTALWLDRLEREHDNLRAALRRCIDRRDARIGLRLGAALWSYWYVRGYVAEGRSNLALLLTLPGADTDPEARARALLGAGQLALTQADHAAARSALSESVALHRANGDARGLAEALLAAGFAARLEEDYAAADPLLHEALALGRGIGHTFVTAASLHHLGLMAVDVRGDLAQARSLLDESLTLYSALGLPRFVALLLLALGDLARAAGDTARARDFLARGLTMMRDVGEGLGLHGALDALAHLASVEGRTARAVRLAAAADRLRIAGGTRAWPVVERARARWLASARTSLGQVGFDGAWREGAALSPGEAVAVALDEGG
jgi:tetratricopeptide (TPR) repeat protein